MATAAAPPVGLQKNHVVLFQGDSITDAGRDKSNASANSVPALGMGYAAMVSAALLGSYAPLRLQCLNRGISGNKVPDLQARWQAETLDLKPSLLSILIGVNDMWHKLSGDYQGTVDDYEKQLGALIGQTRRALPETQIAICEPFVLRCGSVDASWFPEFDLRRTAAQRVAEGVGALWVPFQAMFDDAITDDMPPEYWAADGVHPTGPGHALMARKWLDITGL